MKISKEFRWEMGHRLQLHKGLCKNLHGHSYKMDVELTGEILDNGMVLDYYDLKEIVGPVVEELDHSFLVNKYDTEILEVLEKLDSRRVVVDFETTAENICHYILKKIKENGLPENISKVKVKVFETESTYAEDEIEV